LKVEIYFHLNIVVPYSSFHGKMSVLAGKIPVWGYGSKYVNILPRLRNHVYPIHKEQWAVYLLFKSP
jgi:hypothetical protein